MFDQIKTEPIGFYSAYPQQITQTTTSNRISQQSHMLDNEPKLENNVTTQPQIVCEAAFCRKPYLEVHMRTHTGERPFQCDLCLKRFSQKSSLNTHKRIHSGFWSMHKPFQCTQCNAAFSRKPYLDIHNRIHTGERPFECETCSKRFTQKSTLNIHKRIHSAGHRPFQCEHCPAAFGRKPYLDIHIRSHTGERPFECATCLKRFSQRSTLNIHKRIHTGERPYACDICNKTFAVKSYVTAHRWSHVSEKPLNCDRCSMTFTSKSQFAIHIRTHSAGQNYECNICGRTFIRDSYLIRHHNRVHRENRLNNNNINAVINSVAVGEIQQTNNVEGSSEIFNDRYVSDVHLNGAVTQMQPQDINIVSNLHDFNESRRAGRGGFNNIQLKNTLLNLNIPERVVAQERIMQGRENALREQIRDRVQIKLFHERIEHEERTCEIQRDRLTHETIHEDKIPHVVNNQEEKSSHNNTPDTNSK